VIGVTADLHELTGKASLPVIFWPGRKYLFHTGVLKFGEQKMTDVW